MHDGLSYNDELRNEQGDLSDKEHQRLQEEIDSIDVDYLRVQLLTALRKKQVVKRLNKTDVEMLDLKSLYKEYEEMMTEFTASEVAEMDDIHCSVIAFFIDQTYLEDLYKYKQLQNKWG